MQNPAWRPARLHTERLARIGHHFISENQTTRIAVNASPTHKLRVLVAIEPAHPPDALQPDYLVNALTRQLNVQTPGIEKMPGWQLTVHPSSRMPDNGDTRCILVFATASLDGIRLAYTQIKQLSQNPARRIGILFSGACDHDVAYRCYDRLASGTEQFLHLRLHMLGNLSAPGPSFGAGLSQLAGEIQGLCQAQSKNNPTEVEHS
ncbi:MAG: hypothetical protein WBO57_09005 [Gammaproteobacteria bacterium]